MLARSTRSVLVLCLLISGVGWWLAGSAVAQTFTCDSTLTDPTYTNPYTGETISLVGTYDTNTQLQTYSCSDGVVFVGCSANLTIVRLENEVGDLLIDFCPETILLGSTSFEFLNFASTTHLLGDLTLLGAPGGNIVWGNVGNDILQGDTGDDILNGGPGNDELTSSLDDDRLIGASGDDTLTGGPDFDTAVYFGNFADYTISVVGSETTVQDNVGDDGTDTVTEVERFEFADGYLESGVFISTLEFIRGDANADGTVDLGDVIVTLDTLFAGVTTSCSVAVDANDDDALDISDPTYLLGHLFLPGSPPPPAPYPACGSDPTPGTTDAACDFPPCP